VDASLDGQQANDDGGSDAGSVVAVPLSACIPTVYTAPVTIGSQTFQLTVDTGSTTLGVASKSCTSCGVSPTYSPSTSAVDQKQTATSQYASGSWSGEIYQDGVSAGSAPGVQVDLVAIDQQSQFFVPSQCDSTSGGYQGIVGFGPPGSALQGTNGYFDQFVAADNVPNIFATQLCDSEGTLWLGGYDPSAMTAAPVYTPEISAIDAYYYAVELDSITVNGTSIPVASGTFSDSLVDTGTSVWILATPAFDALTSAIASSPNFTSLFGSAGASWFSNPGNCTALSKTKAEIDAALPPLTLVFGSTSVQAAPTESYLLAAGGEWCPALYAVSPGPNFPVASILGSPVLRSNIVIFDRQSKRIGFAPHKPCP
jgi:Eukaryotic aspartyl protease